MERILLVLCVTSAAIAQFPPLLPGDEDLPGGPPGEGGPPGIGGGHGSGLPGNQPFCPQYGIFQMPDVTSCSKFILCNNGLSKPHNCSEGTHFNIERGICINRDNAKCDLCIFNRSPVQFLPDEDDCSKYIVCFGNKRKEFQCANGMLFNPRTRRCDHEDNVVCLASAKSNTPTRLCPQNNRVTFLPSLHTCRDYFVCARGTSSYHQCGKDLIFDIDTNQCAPTGRCLLDYKPKCSADKEISFEPHPYDCRHYFFCDRSKAHVRGCSPGLLFDIAAGQCNVDNLATCAMPPAEDDKLAVWPHV